MPTLNSTTNKLYTIRLALLVGVLVPVILVVATVGSWALRLLEQQVNARMQEDIQLIADAIRLPLSYAMEQGRTESINQALNSAFTIDVVYGAYVYDENGEEIARSGRREGRVETDQAVTLAASGNQSREFSRAGNEEIFSYFVPLTDSGGRITGLLQLTRRGSDFRNYIADVRTTAWVALGALCLVLALIVVAGHHYALGGPLQRMLEGMGQIRGKKPQRRLHAEGPSEIRTIAEGVNNMLNRVENSEKLATIGRLAAGVAHELGSPLAALDGKAQQTLRHVDEDSKTARNLTQIRQQAARMEIIIRQLLDYGRDNPLQRANLDTEHLLKQAYEHALSESSRWQEKPPQVYFKGKTHRIQVDSLRFDQAICNLLRNALHACQGKIGISWRAIQLFGRAGTEIVIEDDGEGVAACEAEYLFDPFFTTKPIGQGTGLGLAVANAAIKDHEGTIDASESKWGGARFTIFIPDL